VPVECVPNAGEIVHADVAWQGPAGGGAIAAVQLARLTGDCILFTALGDDELSVRARTELERLGVRIHAAMRPEPTREAISLVDVRGERTTLTLGRRLEPIAHDELPWSDIGGCDAAYFAAGDGGALRAAREATMLVATARELATVLHADVRVDAIVASSSDPAESVDRAVPNANAPLVVMTDGQRGGTLRTTDGAHSGYSAALPAGPVVDCYGVGDSFAAALTFALGAGKDVCSAVGVAARCGAACITQRGPYAGQLDQSRLTESAACAR
jgi:ribokinase